MPPHACPSAFPAPVLPLCALHLALCAFCIPAHTQGCPSGRPRGVGWCVSVRIGPLPAPPRCRNVLRPPPLCTPWCSAVCGLQSAWHGSAVSSVTSPASRPALRHLWRPGMRSNPRPLGWRSVMCDLDQSLSNQNHVLLVLLSYRTCTHPLPVYIASMTLVDTK